MQQVNFKKQGCPTMLTTQYVLHCIIIVIIMMQPTEDNKTTTTKKQQTMHQSRQKQSFKSPMMNTIRIVLLSYHIIYFL